jgi:phosphatidate cytidylyltransferase
MLRLRVISAVILAPTVVLCLLYLPSQWFAVFLGVIALAAAWEWSTMVVNTTAASVLYVVVCAALMAAALLVLEEQHVRFAMLLGGAYWVFILLLLSFYQTSWLKNYLLESFLHYSGYFVIVVGWLAMLNIHAQNPYLLLFLFALIWIADIAAYFAGKKFGHNKLAEHLSPGKTKEGVLGAIAATFLFALLGVYFWQDKLAWGLAIYFVLLCVLSALISVVGDLFESLLKRNANKKDSGFLIPGHGGVLDRIDSLLAAAPGFMLGLYWLN